MAGPFLDQQGLVELKTRMDESYAPKTHSHSISDVSGLQAALNNKADLADITGAMKIKGSVASYSALPSSPSEGDAYYVQQADASHDIDAGELVCWNGTEWVDVGGTVDFSNYYTRSEVDDLTSGIASAENVYTKSEVDTKLAAKANATHSHGISDVTNLQTSLDGKADSSHGHAISEITNLQTTLNGKAASSHNHTVSQVTDFTTSVQSLIDSSAPTAIPTATINEMFGITE